MSAAGPGLLSRLRLGAVDWIARARLRAGGTERLPRPVISVGNLAFGGTGKTPFTEWLARFLSHEGFVVCILSRGYRGLRTEEPLVVSDLRRIRSGPIASGDEPFLLARKLPGVPVVVGADRVAAGRLALERFPVHLFLLDDGFQHRRLERDVDLVLIDARDPWSHLREGPGGLARAHAIVLTRAHRIGEESLQQLRSEVAARAPGVPVLTARTQVAGFRRVSAAHDDLPSLDDARAFAFCGLARPQAFFEDVEAAGIRIVERRRFADHHPYSKADLRRLLHEAEERGASALVTTEKDAVRLPLPRGHEFPPVHALRHRVVPDDPTALVRVLAERLPPPRTASRH